MANSADTHHDMTCEQGFTQDPTHYRHSDAPARNLCILGMFSSGNRHDKNPVHIIVGAYDLTYTPEDARRTAEAIPGATLAVMDELGHFPMSEHPDGFRPFFVEALSKMPCLAVNLTNPGAIVP